MVKQAVPMQPVEDTGALKKAAAHGAEPMQEQVCWQELLVHRGPTLEQSVPKGLSPGEETHAGALLEEKQPLGGPPLGRSVRSQWQRGAVLVADRLQPPFPFLCATVREEGKDLGTKECS